MLRYPSSDAHLLLRQLVQPALATATQPAQTLQVMQHTTRTNHPHISMAVSRWRRMLCTRSASCAPLTRHAVCLPARLWLTREGTCTFVGLTARRARAVHQVWISSVSSTILYGMTGMMGAMAYTRADGNFLNTLSNTCSPTVTRVRSRPLARSLPPTSFSLALQPLVVPVFLPFLPLPSRPCLPFSSVRFLLVQPHSRSSLLFPAHSSSRLG